MNSNQEMYKLYEIDIQNMFKTIINEINNCTENSEKEILIKKLDSFNRIGFTFKRYQAIKRIQKRMKLRFKNKNDALNI